MQKFISVTAVTLILATLPLLSIAAEHEHGSMGGNMMQHGDMNHGSTGMHDSMSAAGGMIMLGEQTVSGVECMAHMKDVSAAMAKMGMKTTHHFMAMFSDEKTDKAIDSGTVAVKITAPDGTVTGPMELMGMQGHFGADVVLDKPGEYKFQVGSKFADGVARKYEFKTTIK